MWLDMRSHEFGWLATECSRLNIEHEAMYGLHWACSSLHPRIGALRRNVHCTCRVAGRAAVRMMARKGVAQGRQAVACKRPKPKSAQSRPSTSLPQAARTKFRRCIRVKSPSPRVVVLSKKLSAEARGAAEATGQGLVSELAKRRNFGMMPDATSCPRSPPRGAAALPPAAKRSKLTLELDRSNIFMAKAISKTADAAAEIACATRRAGHQDLCRIRILS